MNSFGTRELPRVFRRIRELVDADKEHLTELDSLMGDGDLGLTMEKAFHAAEGEMSGASEPDVGRCLLKVGAAIAKAAPSTMGTLVATGFMKGGKSLSGRQEVDVAALAGFFEAFVQGIMDRGKAKLGEKTILDSLEPAARALRTSGTAGVPQALQKAATAAKEGMEATRAMEPAHGKGFYHKEAGRGVEDPGARTGFLIVQGFFEGLGQGEG
ncbi:MAG: dihydroxyacetone kinase family protein [Spirochaetia bacterium]